MISFLQFCAERFGIPEQVTERIVKVGSGYRLLSSKGKNLGTFPTKAGAKNHEREVQFFKHQKS